MAQNNTRGSSNDIIAPGVPSQAVRQEFKILQDFPGGTAAESAESRSESPEAKSAPIETPDLPEPCLSDSLLAPENRLGP